MHHVSFHAERRSTPHVGAHVPGRCRTAFPAQGEAPRQIHDAVFHFDGFEIRPVTTKHQVDAVGSLVRRMYQWRGYRTDAVHRDLDPDRVTLAAWQGEDALATLTLNKDCAEGLLCDELYGPEIDAYRSNGKHICEVSRLAVDPEASSRYLRIALFRAAQQYAKDAFGSTDAFIEVNPRHAKYYGRELGFAQVGELRQCPRVNAPAVLLHKEISSIALPVKLERAPTQVGGAVFTGLMVAAAV